MRKSYYPIFTDLQGRRCVVIGGGAIAQRKVTTLLQYGADITVISPTATRRLLAYATQGRVRYQRRRFRPADLRGAWLVYASTNEERINQLVHETAARLRIFANVVDQPQRCSFIAPAIMRRGDLTIAISTGGASPTVAKRLRREFARGIGEEYPRLLRLLAGLRAAAKRQLPRYNDRKRYFSELVEGRVFQLVRAGDTVAARREALKLLKHQTSSNGHGPAR